MFRRHSGFLGRCGVGLLLALVRVGFGAEAPGRWPVEAFRPLTEVRIAELPVAEQTAWRAYWAESAARNQALKERSSREIAPTGPIATLPKGAAHTQGLSLLASAVWFRSHEAAAMADRIVEWQTTAGGWTKGIDYGRPRSAANQMETDVWSRGTLDNDATTTELRFLARAITADGATARSRPWREAFLRGLDYLFAAQYPNGGFPQIYPLAGGYHDAITFNDSAMTQALEVLRDAAAGKGDFAFVPAAQRNEAGHRLVRGIGCILAAQVRRPDGRRTGWGQQHDPLTLQPCAARNFEPISVCSAESAGLVDLLMSLPEPSPTVVAAVGDAVAWFEHVALRDVVWDRQIVVGSGLRAAPGASRLWARMYEIGTDRPVFGDRDRTIHFVVTEISPERRLGYAWYGNGPEGTISRYEEWRKAQTAVPVAPSAPGP